MPTIKSSKPKTASSPTPVAPATATPITQVAAAAPAGDEMETENGGAVRDVLRVLTPERVAAIIQLVRSGQAKTAGQLAEAASQHPAFAGAPADRFTNVWASRSLRTIVKTGEKNGVDLSDLTLERPAGGFRGSDIDWAQMAAL